jgi:transcriptional regulator with XRE-family HTH domain
VATNPVPPEAALIRERRKAHLPSLSVAEAAAAATAAGVKMSETGWRAIESGRYDGPPDKLAIMAQVVGVTADELAEIGRQHRRENASEAGRLLESHVRQRAAAEPAVVASSIDAGSAPERVLQAILKGLDAIRAAEVLTDGQKSSLEQALMDAVEQTVEGQIVQIRTTLEILGERGR